MSKIGPLQLLDALAGGNCHTAYRWAAIVDDGSLICERCARENRDALASSTRAKRDDGYNMLGLMHSGEAESPENCALCNVLMWGEE